MEMFFKILVLFYCVFGLLPGCTTTRPLTATEVKQQKIEDTLRRRTLVVNNPTQAIFRDTVFSQTNTKELTREVVNTVYLDTAKLAGMMAGYFVQAATEREAIKISLLAMEKFLLASKVRAVDSVRTLMQAKIDTSTLQAKEVLDAGNKVVYGLSNIWLILACVSFLVYLAFRYLKARAQRKKKELETLELELETTKTPASA